jgi:D-dopachrome decarboxylase
MPICTVETNLATSQVPADFHLKFSKMIADVLNKPEEKISVTLTAGLRMCRGASDDPTVTVHIWSINVFDADRNGAYAVKMFDFFRRELPIVSDKRVALLYHPLEAHQPQAVA